MEARPGAGATPASGCEGPRGGTGGRDGGSGGGAERGSGGNSTGPADGGEGGVARVEGKRNAARRRTNKTTQTDSQDGGHFFRAFNVEVTGFKKRPQRKKRTRPTDEDENKEKKEDGRNVFGRFHPSRSNGTTPHLPRDRVASKLRRRWTAWAGSPSGAPNKKPNRVETIILERKTIRYLS